MARGRPNLRSVRTVLAWSAIALVAAALLMVSAGRGASAAGPFDLTGVTCMDLYLDVPPLQAKGTAHGAEDLRVGKILSRIEPSATQVGAWDVTSVAYTGPDTNNDLIPDKPPTATTCEEEKNGNQLNPSVKFQFVDVNERPTATAKLVEKAEGTNLEFTVCQVQSELLGGLWVRSDFNIVVDGKPETQDFGTLTALLGVSSPTDPADPTTCGTDAALVFNIVLESTARDVTKAAPQAGVPDSGNGDAGVAAAALTTGALTLVAAAWYVTKRWPR